MPIEVMVMNKFKMVLGYLLGFIVSVLLVVSTVLILFRLTIFNKVYVLKVLDNVNYYGKVYEDINKDFSNSLRSSGLDDSVIDGIYSSSDAERDIRGFIGSIYSGSNYDVNVSLVKDKLNNNVDNYLKNKDLKIEKKLLDKYIDGIVSIYEDQIKCYGYLDGFINKFVKIQRYLDIFIVLILIVSIVSFMILRYFLHKRYSGVITLSSGLMLIYLKCFIYDGIDFKNIVLISDSFSDFVRAIFNDIGNYLLIVASFYIIIGIILNVKSSMMKLKRKRRI